MENDDISLELEVLYPIFTQTPTYCDKPQSWTVQHSATSFTISGVHV